MEKHLGIKTSSRNVEKSNAPNFHQSSLAPLSSSTKCDIFITRGRSVQVELGQVVLQRVASTRKQQAECWACRHQCGQYMGVKPRFNFVSPGKWRWSCLAG